LRVSILYSLSALLISPADLTVGTPRQWPAVGEEDQQVLDEYATAVLDQVGRDAYESALSDGRMVDLQDAVAYALDDLSWPPESSSSS
jgi:hypothetical protein